MLTVSINADGSVGRIDINRSSGHKVLDDAAASSDGWSPTRLSPDIRRKDTDILEITRTWYFTQGNNLETGK